MKTKFSGNRGERGEIVLATATVMILVGIVGFLAGSSGLSRLVPFLKDKGAKTAQTFTTKTETKPVIIKGQDGKSYVLESTTTQTSTSKATAESKMTLMERVLLLPKLWVLLMGLGIFFPPIAGIMGFVNARLKAKAGSLMKETKKIVVGVEESLNTLEAQKQAEDAIFSQLRSLDIDPVAQAKVNDALKALDALPYAKDAVLNSLSRKYDQSTKALVSKIKQTVV